MNFRNKSKLILKFLTFYLSHVVTMTFMVLILEIMSTDDIKKN